MTPRPARDVWDSQPARYREPWKEPFDCAVQARLRPGITVLDIGSGRQPSLSRSLLPRDATYVGLDPSSHELASAPAGSYDREVVAPAEAFVSDLSNQVDLVVSWQVFEHFRSMETAIGNIYRYLRPGGSLVSLFSGRWSVFGVLNRLLPARVGFPIIDRVAQRTARGKPIFPAYYDACYASALRKLTSNWTAVEITPLYRGGSYFAFAKPAVRAYLFYENVIERRQWADAATHYLLVATR